jgi:hypothetical protein
MMQEQGSRLFLFFGSHHGGKLGRMQREKKARLSLAPLKFREAVSNLLKIKPEIKAEPKPKAKWKPKK